MKLGVAIPHVKERADRRAWVADIRREIPDAVVVADIHRSLWKTHAAAWRVAATIPGVTHAMLIQDDFAPCPNFLPLALGAIERCPTSCLNFFTTRTRAIAAAEAKGTHLVRQADSIWGCYVLPVEHVGALIRWTATYCGRPWQPKAVRNHTDERPLYGYCYAHGIDVIQTVPPLCSHVGAKASLIGNSGGFHREPVMLHDGSEIDWSADPVDVPPVTSLKEMMAGIDPARIDALRAGSPA